MSRFVARFQKLTQKNDKKPIIGFYIMSEYPNYQLCLKLLKKMSDQGVAFIEIGLPFSDSPVDGPTIQLASEFSLSKQQGDIKTTFALIKEFREYDNEIPIVIMGCYNPIYQYGINKFVIDSKISGVDSLLMADLPIEEEDKLQKYSKDDLDLIHLITPLTSDKRFVQIEKISQGFLYFTSLATITGDKVAVAKNIENLVSKFRAKTDLPICVGFGVKTPQIAQEINKFSDGVIIGSVLINKIASYMEEDGKLKVTEQKFIEEVAQFMALFFVNN
jgi:tryptophan synthase alpha chain